MSTEPTINLNPDDKAVAMRTIRELFGSLGHIHEALKGGTGLNVEMATNILKLGEFHLADLGKILAIETDSALERERRNADLRNANLRVHELQKQLGNAQAPELTQLSLKALSRHLRAWWTQHGFGHVSEIQFGEHSCRATFSCHLFGDRKIVNSSTPVSDELNEKAWHEELVQRGFVLNAEGREISLRDCDQNRSALNGFFEKSMPSATVFKHENVRQALSGIYVLRSVDVTIRDIAEILALPVPDKAED